MKKLLTALLVAVALAFLLAPIALLSGCYKCHDPECSNLPPVEPDYPASDRDGLGTPIGDACGQLRKMGCPEGYSNAKGRTCFESYTDAAKLAAVPAACLKSSSSQNEVRACGDANSVRVRCAP